jgi:predicted AAA+ superfamily ATPase
MLLKSEIEKSYKTQKASWKNKLSGLKREKAEGLTLSDNYILIITGIRRCGKSTLMHQLSQRENEPSAHFNFEDFRIFGFELSDFSKLDDIIGKEVQCYFFDEIQNVPNWEIYIRELHDKGNKICITGSNAAMLSKELGTKLTGRNLQIELFPFSYTEYCQFQKCELNASSFSRYLADGGFPDYLKTKQKEYLQQLFKDIIYRDIIVRYGIRNANSMIEIALFLISNTAKEYSLNSIKKAFGVGSANSVANYVQWLEDAYILFSIPRFSPSLKSRAVNPKKVYTIDAGFAQANSLSFSDDIGRIFENVIFLELRRNYNEIFYFKEHGECDFIVKKGKEICHILQVCVELHPDNMKREISGLIEALSYFNKEEGVIITLNQHDEIWENGKKIRLLPAHEWLSDMNYKY